MEALCTSWQSHPPANLTWWINEEKVKSWKQLERSYIFTRHCCHHRFSWSWPQWWYRKTSGSNEPHARILNDGVVKIWWCYYGIIIERAMVTEWILCQNLSGNMGLMRSPGCNNSRIFNKRKHKSPDDQKVFPGEKCFDCFGPSWLCNFVAKYINIS